MQDASDGRLGHHSPAENDPGARTRALHAVQGMSAVRRYAFKRSQLIALRPNKISADNPASEMWPGERD